MVGNQSVTCDDMSEHAPASMSSKRSPPTRRVAEHDPTIAAGLMATERDADSSEMTLEPLAVRPTSAMGDPVLTAA